MFEISKHNSKSLIQHAVFRLRSAAIIAITIIAAFAAGAYWWLALMIGGAIWLLQVWETSRNPAVQARLYTDTQVARTHELTTRLAQWVESLQGDLPPDILLKVESIKRSLVEILPKIENINSSDYNVFIVRQIAESYLPETIANYQQLTPDFARNKPIREDKTAHQLLLEQLDLLDNEMQQMAADFQKNDMQRLLAHGRFLREKFGQSDLLDL